MKWSALIILVTALSVYSPFASTQSCEESSCCTQMEACCGHCVCPATTASCGVAKPAPLDQQAMARTAQAPARTEVMLFSLTFNHLSISFSATHHVAYLAESPPPKPAQPPQSRLCVWLI